MKRYRDAAGRLTMKTAEIARLTEQEARDYYSPGGRYIYQGIAYSLEIVIDETRLGQVVEMAIFHGINSESLFVPVENLGTFLPDVSSDGQEITAF